MNIFDSYYKRTIKQNCVNKFVINKHRNIPKLEEITLNFRCENFSIHKFATTMLALEIITKKKSEILVSKKPNILLKMQKGLPVGCKVRLKNEKLYSFIARLSIEILTKSKNLSGFKVENRRHNFSFQLAGNQIFLKEFENSYPLFANLPILNINIKTNSTNPNEKVFLAKSLKIPLL